MKQIKVGDPVMFTAARGVTIGGEVTSVSEDGKEIEFVMHGADISCAQIGGYSIDGEPVEDLGEEQK